MLLCVDTYIVSLESPLSIWEWSCSGMCCWGCGRLAELFLTHSNNTHQTVHYPRSVPSGLQHQDHPHPGSSPTRILTTRSLAGPITQCRRKKKHVPMTLNEPCHVVVVRPSSMCAEPWQARFFSSKAKQRLSSSLYLPSSPPPQLPITMSNAEQDTQTAKDYYFDSYAHFGKIGSSSYRLLSIISSQRWWNQADPKP